MRLILKVVITFVIVALLALLVLVYLEQKDGLNTSPSDVWADVKDVGKSIGDSVGGFFESSGIKEGTADLLEQGADAIRGDGEDSSPAPEETAVPTATP